MRPAFYKGGALLVMGKRPRHIAKNRLAKPLEIKYKQDYGL